MWDKECRYVENRHGDHDASVPTCMRERCKSQGGMCDSGDRGGEVGGQGVFGVRPRCPLCAYASSFPEYSGECA